MGGAVRDLVLGIAPKDFDVTTNATPEQVQKLFFTKLFYEIIFLFTFLLIVYFIM